jgi:hemerythrin
MRVAPEKSSSYLVDKMKYLKHFCGQHLAFEEDVMTLLAMNYGFSQSDYNAHVQSHVNFSKSLLSTLSDQIDYFVKCGDSAVVEELVVESLKDVAKWWYYHIADSDKNSKVGHDHVYRQHIKTLTQEQQLSLLNEIITKAELAE